jgi:hypothetical protein
MSDEFLNDEHGQVYERSWNGNYEQKWDFWSQQPVKESGQRERSPKDYLDDGTPLFRGNVDKGVISNSGADGFLELVVSLLVLAFIALAIPLIKLVFEKIVVPLFHYFLEYIKVLIHVWKMKSREFRQLSLAGLLGFLSILLIKPGNSQGAYLVISGVLGIVNIYLILSTMFTIKSSQQ